MKHSFRRVMTVFLTFCVLMTPVAKMEDGFATDRESEWTALDASIIDGAQMESAADDGDALPEAVDDEDVASEAVENTVEEQSFELGDGVFEAFSDESVLTDEAIWELSDPEVHETPEADEVLPGEGKEAIDSETDGNVNVDEVPIDDVHFPDEGFRQIVVDYDTDGNSVLSVDEIMSFKTLQCGDNVYSLQGIEYCPYLESIDISYNNQILSLEIRGFHFLNSFQCVNSSIETLDLSGCSNLSMCLCENNYQLNTLELNGCAALSDLRCNDNALTTLSLEGCSSLEVLHCDNNELATLNLKDCSCLGTLICANNPLSELDLRNHCILSTRIRNNYPETLESGALSYNEYLIVDPSVKLVLPPEGIPLDSAHFPDERFRQALADYDDGDGLLSNGEIINISSLHLEGREIASLEGIGNLVSLNYLFCSNNRLTTLDLSQNLRLYEIDCSDNQLTTLNLGNNQELETLNCSGNRLAQLNIADCPKLIEQRLEASYSTSDDGSVLHYGWLVYDKSVALFMGSDENTLELPIDEDSFPDTTFRAYVSEHFDLDGDGYLSRDEVYEASNIDLNNAGVTSLEGVRHLIGLKEIHCSDNSIKSLNLNGLDSLRTLECASCGLESLDIDGCDNLYYIDVQDNRLETLNFGTVGRGHVDCSYNQLTRLSVTIDHWSTRYLNCSHNQLTELDLMDTKEENLQVDCSYNQLSTLDYRWDGYSLDFSHNALTELTLGRGDSGLGEHLLYLYCNDNYLSELDVSTLPHMRELICYNNRLAALDLSHNSELRDLICEGNPFKWISIENCPYLKRLYEYQSVGYNGEYLSYSVYSHDLYGMFTLDADDYVYTGSEDAMGILLIDSARFPDPSFRACVSAQLDRDANGMLSAAECSQSYTIDCSAAAGYGDITSLEGIGNLPNLMVLHCEDNQLTELDLSNNTKLAELYCGGNRLTSLALDHHSNMTTLSCCNNRLTEIRFNDYAKYESLDLSGNALESLRNIDSDWPLHTLNCSSNHLNDLYLGGLTYLESLDCTSNALQTLNIHDCKDLAELKCHNNRLTTLDINDNMYLLALVRRGERAANDSYIAYSMDGRTLSYDATVSLISDMSVLENGIPLDEAHFPDERFRNLIRPFDIDGDGCMSKGEIAFVTRLEISAQKIASLKGIEYFTALNYLDCSENRLTTLDVSNNRALATLSCEKNILESLILCQEGALEYLNASWNRLGALELGFKPQLYTLYAYDNAPLKALDIGGCPLLRAAYPHKNSSEIPLEKYGYEHTVVCYSTVAGSRRVRLIVPPNITIHDEEKINPNDVVIDDQSFPDKAFREYVSQEYDQNEDGRLSRFEVEGVESIYCHNSSVYSLEGIQYFTELRTLGCSNSGVTSLDLSKCLKLRELECAGSNIQKLNVQGCQSLTKLSCANSQLNALDVSGLPELSVLSCSDTPLQTLNVSGCSSLVTLFCSHTPLTELNLSGLSALEDVYVSYGGSLNTLKTDGCTALKSLDCNGNALTALDLSQSPALERLACQVNHIKTLDLRSNTALLTLFCYSNPLTEVVAGETLRNVFLRGERKDNDYYEHYNYMMHFITSAYSLKENDRDYLVEVDREISLVAEPSPSVPSEPTVEPEPGPIDDTGVFTIRPVSDGPLALKKTVQLNLYDDDDKLIPAKSVTWATSAKAVATVSKGKVKGVSVGTAVITASYNGETARFTIEVYDPSAPTAIAFRVDASTVAVKKTLDLNKLLVVTPSKAKTKSLIWQSSDPSVATVSKGKVKGVSLGTAVIRVGGGNLEGISITIEVSDPNAPKTLAFKDGASPVVAVKKTIDLTKLLAVTPTTVKVKNLPWKSSDPSVATVSKGKVKGVALGTAVITVGGGKMPEASITVEVSDPNAPKTLAFKDGAAPAVAVKKTIDLTKQLLVTPSTVKVKNLKWISSDTNVATVSKGKVKGKSAGTAEITVSNVKGDVTASITVTVQ